MSESKRKRVYVAGPISKGDLAHNVNQATEAFVALAKASFAPFCPHWSVYCKPCMPWRFSTHDAVICEATANGTVNAGMDHATWLAVDCAWVEVADCVLRLPGESKGADMEVLHAAKHGITTYFDLALLLQHESPTR